MVSEQNFCLNWIQRFNKPSDTEFKNFGEMNFFGSTMLPFLQTFHHNSGRGDTNMVGIEEQTSTNELLPVPSIFFTPVVFKPFFLKNLFNSLSSPHKHFHISRGGVKHKRTTFDPITEGGGAIVSTAPHKDFF